MCFFIAVLKSRKNINNKKPWAKKFSLKNKKINFIDPGYYFKKVKISKILKRKHKKMKYKEKLKIISFNQSFNFKNAFFKKKNAVKKFLYEFINF